jgi:hypothetical protein
MPRVAFPSIKTLRGYYGKESEEGEEGEKGQEIEEGQEVICEPGWSLNSARALGPK